MVFETNESETNMASVVQYNFPTIVRSGAGARHRLPEDLTSRGVSRPLVVTDRGVAALPLADDIMTILREGGVEPALFSEVWGNPVASQVWAGVEAYRAHNADSIVALGGGAPMDVAKVIGIMAHHPGDIFDYEDGNPNALPVDQHIPVMVAVATTAGTGSEVGRSSVISDDETHVKKIIFDPKMLPVVAYLDPELTLRLPAGITASTGMDALTHLVEAFLAPMYHPMADGIALEGIRLVARSLVKAVDYAKNNPGDTSDDHVNARNDMLNASMMGATAFQKGLGVTHSLAHALSAVCDTHHGVANAVLIPYCMEFNAEAAPELFTRMAVAAGLEDTTPAGFVQWLRDLQGLVGIPATLREVGVTEEHLDELTRLAYLDPCHGSNPRPCSEADLRALYIKALGE